MDNLRWQKGPLNNYKSLACGKTSTALSIYSLFLTPAEIHFARIFSHRNCVIPMTSTAPEKRLIVAVEGTAALGPYWRTIVNDYLEKIVRYFFLLFCLIEGIEKKKDYISYSVLAYMIMIASQELVQTCCCTVQFLFSCFLPRLLIPFVYNSLRFWLLFLLLHSWYVLVHLLLIGFILCVLIMCNVTWSEVDFSFHKSKLVIILGIVQSSMDFHILRL